MLVLDPDRRLRASEALAHPFFAEYHNEDDEQEGTPLDDELISSDSLTIDQWKGKRFFSELPYDTYHRRSS